jgi:hypothetical protein
MKKKLIKVLFVATSVILFSLILKSCKKIDDSVSNTNIDKERKEAAIKAVIAQNGNVSKAIIFPMDKNADLLLYRDTNDIMVKFHSPNTTSNVLDCNSNCSNTSNPNDLVQTYTLRYIQRNYMCDGGSLNSDLVANWLISIPYVPLLADPNNSSNLSYGNISITGGGNTITSGNITDITIRDKGADGSCTGHNLYEITYKFQNIAHSYFNDALIEASINLYNDCSIVGNNVQTGYVYGPLAPNQTTEQTENIPCERTDKVWISPGSGSNPATALGCYSICWYPSSNFTPTTSHQIQWRQKNATNGSNHWDDQGSAVNTPTGLTISPYTGYINLTGMYNGSGTWLVRYRNRASICNSTSALWSGVYVTEIWPL